MRPVRLVLLGLLACALGATVAFWPWIDAQRRAAILLSGTSPTPVLSWVLRTATGSPKIEQTTLGGAPATLLQPAHGSSWHAVLLLPGTADQGRDNPRVMKLAKAIARAGYLVGVPDLPGMADGEIVPASVQATIDAAVGLSERGDASGGQVALVGAWSGASVALLAAEDQLLAPRVSVVAAVAPWAAMPDALRLATTGFVLDGGQLKAYSADPKLALVTAKSLAASLPASTDRSQLLQLLQGVSPTDPDPLKVVRGLALGGMTPAAAAVVSLLGNTHAPSFDGFYAALPESLHAEIEKLSPLVGASQLEGRVEIAVAGNDRYAPVTESQALERASPHVHVTVTGGVRNGLPAPGIGDAFSTDAWLVRVLKAAD